MSAPTTTTRSIAGGSAGVPTDEGWLMAPILVNVPEELTDQTSAPLKDPAPELSLTASAMRPDDGHHSRAWGSVWAGDPASALRAWRDTREGRPGLFTLKTSS